MKRALFIQPHPDDNDISAGGTVAKLVNSGTEVHYLTITDD
ncbi:PIG-L deacetylase family protein [Chungangia koreensis]|uniref:PIG-L deacetylase family protein n=1 Tax=Chungangia koreensis TaxID=752657 RepID=A0ABV8XC95_9LACT